jgi:hypothetical protein
MTADDLIRNARSRGLVLEVVDGDRVRVTGGRLTDPERDAIRRHRADVVDLLEAEVALDDANERAGIREHSGGLPRPEAEAEAVGDVFRRRGWEPESTIGRALLAVLRHQGACLSCVRSVETGCPAGRRLWVAYREHWARRQAGLRGQPGGAAGGAA